MGELKAYEGAVELMHDSDMSDTLPNVLCQFGYDFFNQGDGQERKASAIFRSAVKEHSSYVDMLKLGYKLARHL
jgi:electron transfer flavoprotein-quinone oxidoreductase